jgi:outer membrane cobalamin receptor
VFFIPYIHGSFRALSSVGGEGFPMKNRTAFLLLMAGISLSGSMAAAPDRASDGSSGSADVSPDSIRFIYPPHVVEDSRWSRREKASELLLTVIGTERLNATASLNLGDALTGIPGVYLRKSGGPGSPAFLTMRGATAQQVLILLNGRKLNTSQGSSVDLSWLDPRGVDRVEIYRDGRNASWGSESIGGVLNIVTSGREETRFHLRTLGGSYGARALSAGGGIGEERRLDFGGSYRASGGDFEFLDPRREGDRRRANAEYRSRSYSGTLEWPAGTRRTILFHLNGGEDHRGAPGPIEFPTPEARLTDRRLFLQGTVIDSSGSSRITLGAGLHHMDRWYGNPDPVLWADDRHINTGTSVNADMIRDLAVPVRLEWGGAFEADHLSSTTDGKRQRGRFATYMMTRIESNETEASTGMNASITPGVRIEKTGGYETRFLPSVSSRVSFFNDVLIVRGSLGQKYRTPSFDELFWPLSSGSQGNPDLRPERSTAVEFSGTSYLFDRSFRLRGTVFHRSLSDLIEWIPGAQGIWSPHNVGHARERGVEIEAAFSGKPWRHLPSISADISHSVIRATDEGDDPLTRGNQLVRRPETLSSGSVEFFFVRHMATGLSWVRVGRRYLTRANTKWTEPHNVIDLHVRLLLWVGGSVVLSVDNLLDRNYYDMDEFPVPGRSLTVMLDVAMR